MSGRLTSDLRKQLRGREHLVEKGSLLYKAEQCLTVLREDPAKLHVFAALFESEHGGEEFG